jgi:hypothetical protein
MKNPAGGEQRQLSKKVELFYNDVNGIPVRTELGPQYIQVLDTVFDRSISMDKPAYQANEEAEISVNIQNLSGYALNIDAKVVVEDREGALLKEIATMQLLNFAAGETKSFGPLFFNTGSIYAGDYRALLLLYEGSKQIGTASADFEILPDIAVSTNIVTDKIFYMPNEQATLTGTVTNQSLNYVMGNLTAKIAITQGPEETVQFYAGTKEIPILLQGGASTFKTIWNTGTNPAGTYIVTLEVLDAAGVVLSDSTRELTIASTTEPSALLKGEMSLDKQSVLSGEPVTVSYSLSNAGNVDLSDVSLSVQTVSMTDETVCDSINDQATLAMGATYTNSGQIDTQGYSAKDYLVVLQANIAGVTETLAGTYFRVNDSTPPELSVDSPVEGEVYRDEVLFTVHAIDTESGINRVEYRLDEQESWNILTLSDSSDDTYLARWETTFEDDGQHILAVRGFDKAGNQAGPATVAFNILNDFTPPETRLEIGEPYFEAPDGPVYVTVDTPFTLAATDDLSGVQATYYRFNEEQDWRVYYGAFQLADLGFGPHTLHFRTVDISGNQEDEKSDQVTLIGVEMETEILNPPRVLVWAGEPAKKVNYTLADIRTLVEEVLATPDAYFKLTTDKAEFQTEFRSGLYNMVFILDRDISLNAPFLREILDAVSGGKGLLVSGGNNVHPFLQETLGVDFRGSLPMADGEHALYLYPGVLSDGQTLLVKGRVLKTKLDGGDLAGIVLGEKTCSGLRKVTLHYPVALAAGDVITVTLYQEENGELRPLDEERYTIDSLPAAPACAVSGNPSGDVSIGTIASDGATASVSAPFGQLGDHYLLSVRVDRPDGSSITGDVSFRSTCSANLQSGVLIGPFRVQSVEEDNLTGREDVPAIVLGRYGRGRTAFISYNIVESALQGHRQEQSDLLGRAAAYLLPETELNVMQVANRIKVHGAGLNLTAIDSLGKGLLYLPIFGLENKSLEYRFHLADDEEYTYRYFIKGSEDAEYSISTGLYLELGDETLLFDRHTFSLSPP